MSRKITTIIREIQDNFDFSSANRETFPYFTAKEVAQLLGLKHRYILFMSNHKNYLPCISFNRTTLFPKTEIMKLVKVLKKEGK